ncbi:MAG TPA: sugar ABC transporter permease [Acholeplasma sp.]|nr:sugar ABC transporter permease [Acholeplasma sp.]
MKKFLSFFAKIDKSEQGKQYLVLFNFIKIRITHSRREAFIGYIFIGIWIIGFLWLTVYPLFMSLIYSFANVTIPGGQGVRIEFNGFQNYIDILNDFQFLSALQSFVIQLLLYLPLAIIISMMIAILLNQKIKMRGFFRSIFFLPVIIASGPIMATLFGSGERAGLLNQTLNEEVPMLLQSFLPEFLSEFVTGMYAHLIVILWFSGVQIILFLAGLQKINKEIYEAASIDGASPWESFWKITLPSLKPIILVSAIYTIVMLSTFPNNRVLFRINVVRQSSFGDASALSWVYSLVVALFLGIVSFILLYERKAKEKKVNMEVKR